MPDFSEIEAQVIKYKKSRNNLVGDRYLKWAVNHHSQIAQIIEDLTEEGDLVLDDGCGNRLHWVGIKNREMIGVDLDPSWIEKTRDLPTGGHFILADSCHLPFPDDRFSLVVSINVLEHISKERRVVYINEMKRVAQRYYLSCPHSLGFIYSILHGHLGTSIRNKEHLFWKLPTSAFLHRHFEEEEFLYTRDPKYKCLLSLLRTLGILKYLYPNIRIKGSNNRSNTENLTTVRKRPLVSLSNKMYESR